MIRNSIQLIGYLGEDPEVVNLKSGKKVMKFNLATTEKWKNNDGEQVESTQWHSCEIWNDALAKYLTKGSQVAVDGKLTYSIYEKKFGDQNVSFKAATINVNEILLLDRKSQPMP